MMKKNKPINMATGGLMNMPPFIKKSEEEKEKGITPYDVNTPKEARQGLPTRLLSPSRTRFNVGGEADDSKFPDKDGSGDVTMKDVLIARGVIDADGNKITKATTHTVWNWLINHDDVLSPKALNKNDPNIRKIIPASIRPAFVPLK